jgi:hypothetical protein
MITSRIVRCLLLSPHPVAPPVQDAPPREGLVEVPLADLLAHAERVPLVLAHPPIVAVAAPAIREEPRVARRATAPSVASIVLPTPVVPLPGPVVASPRLGAHRVHRVAARTATTKESSVPLVATTAMIVSSVTSGARGPRAPGAAAPVLKVAPTAVMRIDPNVRHAATRVVPTRATPGLAPREAKASAVPTTATPGLAPREAKASAVPTRATPGLAPREAKASAVPTRATPGLAPREAKASVVPTTATRARAVVPPVVAHRADRESRVAAVLSTPIARSVRVARCRPARVVIPEPAPDARRAN